MLWLQLVGLSWATHPGADLSSLHTAGLLQCCDVHRAPSSFLSFQVPLAAAPETGSMKTLLRKAALWGVTCSLGPGVLWDAPSLQLQSSFSIMISSPWIHLGAKWSEPRKPFPKVWGLWTHWVEWDRTGPRAILFPFMLLVPMVVSQSIWEMACFSSFKMQFFWKSQIFISIQFGAKPLKTFFYYYFFPCALSLYWLALLIVANVPWHCSISR